MRTSSTIALTEEMMSNDATIQDAGALLRYADEYCGERTEAKRRAEALAFGRQLGLKIPDLAEGEPNPIVDRIIAAANTA